MFLLKGGGLPIPIVRQKHLSHFVALIPRATALPNFVGIIIKIQVLDCLQILENSQEVSLRVS